MGKYRKKPILVNAKQFNGENYEQIYRWIDSLDGDSNGPYAEETSNGGLIIETLEGSLIASPGDWIIRGIKGEYYPCKPDIFKETHDPIEGIF